MKSLKYYWEISGSGVIEVHLDELDEVTPESIREYAMEGIAIEVFDQGGYSISQLRPQFSKADLEAAINKETEDRNRDYD
jgi:hypothetical protein